MASSFALIRPARPGHGPARKSVFSRAVIVTLITLAVCVTGHAQLHDACVTDSFGYSTGSLSGQNGGTGWSSPWTNDYHSGASFNVSGTGMSPIRAS